MNKILKETRELLFLTIYLTLFLNSLTIYHSIILDLDILSYFHLGYNFVEALILAKIIMLGEMLKLGNRYSDRSLIIPTVYKAFIFSLFIFIFTGLEHIVFDYFKGHPFELKHFLDKWVADVGKLLIAFLFFLLLFSFQELKRVVGEDKVFNLFFRRK